MHSYYKILVSSVFLSFLHSTHSFAASDISEIDGRYVSVFFSPYVRPIADPNVLNITEQDISVMLQVIGTRFSKITTSLSAPSNDTDDDMATGAFVAETAAKLNLEREFVKYEMSFSFGADGDDFEGHLRHATNAANEANQIFPGTVVSFLIVTENVSLSTVRHINPILRLWRKEPDFRASNLSLGILLDIEDCDRLSSLGLPIFAKNELPLEMRLVLKQFDFVVVGQDKVEFRASSGVSSSLNGMATAFSRCERMIAAEFPKIKVHQQFSWASKAGALETNGKYFNPYELVTMWKFFANRAVIKRKVVFGGEAFDNPWRQIIGEESNANRGWWRLKEGDPFWPQPLTKEAFVEKITADNIKQPFYGIRMPTDVYTPVYKSPSYEYVPPKTERDYGGKIVKVIIGIIIAFIGGMIKYSRKQNGEEEAAKRNAEADSELDA